MTLSRHPTPLDCFRDSLCRLVRGLVLPYTYGKPTCFGEPIIGVRIAISVALDFPGQYQPFVLSNLPGMFGASVPEASIHEYRHLGPREDEVRLFLRLAAATVHVVAESETVQLCEQQALESCLSRTFFIVCGLFRSRRTTFAAVRTWSSAQPPSNAITAPRSSVDDDVRRV